MAIAEAPSCHALAGAQIKRHALPAPVIHVEFHRRVGLGGTARIHAFFFQIAAHGIAAHRTGGILRAEGMGMNGVLRDRAYGFQHLDLFIAQGFGVHHGRRLHGHQGQQLHQVALDHVAQGPRAFVVIGAIFDAEGLGMGDLDMIDVLAIPPRLQHDVGEPKHQIRSVPCLCPDNDRYDRSGFLPNTCACPAARPGR